MEPKEPKMPEPVSMQTVLLLTLSVNQLSTEAKELKEAVSRGRRHSDTVVMLILLAVIAVGVVAVALTVLFG